MARYVNSVPQILDGNGVPIVGAKKFFFEPGTTTKKTVYSDSALTVVALNPQISDGSGRFSGDIFLDGLYDEIQQDNSGTASGFDGVVLWGPKLVGDTVSGSHTLWVSDTIYNIPDIVLGSDDFYYESLTDSNQGNNPISSPSNWAKITFVKAGVLDGVSEIKDTNSLRALLITPTASAVNYPEITNAATGADPKIEAEGTDANINLELGGKGTGGVELISPIVDGSQNELFKFVSTASAVNEITNTNAATGNGPTLSATGDDAAVDLNLESKGAGVVNVNSRNVESGLVQIVESTTATRSTHTSQIPVDDTIPLITEGVELLTVSITPRYATSKIEISFEILCSASAATLYNVATIVDNTGAATLQPFANYADSAAVIEQLIGKTIVSSPGTSANIYALRVGSSGVGTSIYINGNTGRFFGGNSVARLTAKEIL